MHLLALRFLDRYVPALVVYEYILTIDREFAVVWKRKFNATSALLISVRWMMVLVQVSGWMGVTPQVS